MTERRAVQAAVPVTTPADLRLDRVEPQRQGRGTQAGTVPLVITAAGAARARQATPMVRDSVVTEPRDTASRQLLRPTQAAGVVAVLAVPPIRVATVVAAREAFMLQALDRGVCRIRVVAVAGVTLAKIQAQAVRVSSSSDTRSHNG